MLALKSVENLRSTMMNSHEFKNQLLEIFENDQVRKLHSEFSSKPIGAKVIRQVLRKNHQDNRLDTLEQRTGRIASEVRKTLEKTDTREVFHL